MADSYEMGVKWENQPVTFKSTYFLSNVKDEIGFDPFRPNPANNFDGVGLNSNFGKTQRLGVENFLEIRWSEAFRTRAGYTFTRAQFTKDSLTTTSFKTGDNLPMVPRDRYTLDCLFIPLENWDIHLDMLALSKQVLTNDVTNERNGRRLPAYTVFNLRSSYKWKSWKLSLEVKNLFDEAYESGGSLGAAPGPFVTDPTTTDNFYVPAPGRSFGTVVSYSF